MQHSTTFPVVSIITPCYNSERYIGRYLDSVLNQTYTCIEQIIVDDGSTDNTAEIVQSYCPEFNRKNIILKYIHQSNKGLGGAINTGLKQISGKYFTWCDSDNFYSPEYVEKKVLFFEKHASYAVVRCDGNIVRDTDITNIIGHLAVDNVDKSAEHLFYNAIDEHHFHFGCAMIRTSAFDVLNPTRDIYESRYGQNWQILLPVFYHYLSGYIDEPLFTYVLRSDSITGSIQSTEKILKAFDEYEKILYETISKMHLSPEDENRIMSRVYLKYSHRRMVIYAISNDRAKLKNQYNELEHHNSTSGIDKLVYYLSLFPATAWFMNRLWQWYQMSPIIKKMGNSFL